MFGELFPGRETDTTSPTREQPEWWVEGGKLLACGDETRVSREQRKSLQFSDACIL